MDAIQTTNRVIDTEQPLAEPYQSKYKDQSRKTPQVSEARKQASLNEQPVTLPHVLHCAEPDRGQQRTFLYLAYGSNLCAETFRGKRNIKPLTQTNVVVPELSLTFDLRGIPYSEPCFGNCKYRETNERLVHDADTNTTDYHKDRWKKGLVGVVYEVTAEDYAHIIATEGGGSGYKDVLVNCYVLDDDPSVAVPVVPSTPAFRAHTLFASTQSRPDPSYAQPSARYLKLITDGALEHDLPYEYRAFLDGIRSYRTTTVRQKLGKVAFVAFWGSLFMFMSRGGLKMFLRKDGTYPRWVRTLISLVFRACWISYDNFYYPIFGDGERTLGEEAVLRQGHDLADEEKCGLLHETSRANLI